MLLSTALHRRAPESSRSDANQCLQFTSVLATSALRLNFQGDPSAWHPGIDPVFPTGQPHQPLAVSNLVPAVLEDNDCLFIYLLEVLSRGPPSKWISYMPYSLHFKSDHQKYASSLTENPRVFVNPVNILSCVYTCECIHSFNSLL